MADAVDATMQAEVAAHLERVNRLRLEEDALRAVLEEQQASFTDLVTRVTTLRVAKGEYMASQVSDDRAEDDFRTGSVAVDNLLKLVHAKLRSSSGTGSALLSQLAQAAADGVTPLYPNRVNFNNSKAARTTAVTIATCSDLRSVSAWAARHVKDCTACAQKDAAARAGGGGGSVPAKRRVMGSVEVVRERSMRQRADDDESHVEVLRLVTALHALNVGGGALADVSATAASIQEVASAWAARSLTMVKERVATAAPWNKKETENTNLSVAVAMLLHALTVTVHVEAVKRGVLAHDPRHHKSPGAAAPSNAASDNSSTFRISLSVSVPVHVATLAPLIATLREPEQRRYLIDNLLTPLAEHVGAAVGMAHVVGHYVTVLLNALNAMHRMVSESGLLGSTAKAASPAAKESGSSGAADGSPANSITARLYAIFLALAVFGTRLRAELAVPRHLVSQEEIAALASPTERAKLTVLRAAGALLRNLETISPYAIPARDDPASAAVSLHVTHAPTTFLEALNRTFSSNERLPSTSRSSALDLVMSPKAKLSVALRFFSKLHVDLYCPFDKAATAGAVLSAENGTGGQPKAPPCVPVVDLPPDLVTANAEVNRYSTQLRAKLCALEARASEKTDVEESGQRVLERVAAALGQAEPYQQWQADLRGLGIAVQRVSMLSADVLLPFGVSFVDPRESVNHLLYVRLRGDLLP